MLVGINLLREGLDIPEVSLVAIFDADKEGFLRSERSLIQTMGRAARNLNGKAILYADRITGSMERAMEESNRRRQTQIEFNKKHNITPIGVQKKVLDVMEGAYAAPGSATSQRGRKVARAANGFGQINVDSPADVKKEIKRLEAQMYEQARNLAFEEAAATRDQITHLKDNVLRR